MGFNSEFEKYAIKHRGISSNTLHSYASQWITALTPNIIEERPMNVAVMDVYSRLMMDRIIFLGYPINDEVANIVMAQLLFLDSTDRTRDINMYINSPGGSVYAGLVCTIPCNTFHPILPPCVLALPHRWEVCCWQQVHTVKEQH